MQNTVFLINGRFLVDIERSELLDKKTGEKNRLEPRLMKLLNLLAVQQGKIVKREFIIKEIWDNYPGANEGLNQAISFLRKLLADDHKVVIQTQPKVGYSLHAIISPLTKHPILSGKNYLLLIIGAVVLIILLFFAVNFFMRKQAFPTINKQSTEKNNAEMSRRDSILSRLDSIHQATKLRRLLKDTLGPAAKGDSLRPN